MLRTFLLAAAGLLSCSIFAQPLLTTWPSGKTPGTATTTSSFRTTCERPSDAVFPGEVLELAIDTAGGFGASVTLTNPTALNFGTGTIIADTLFRYVANTSIGSGGVDVALVSACNADGACQEFVYEIAVGRRGVRRDTSFSASDNEVIFFEVPFPGGPIRCGEITEIGQYDGANRRAFSYSILEEGLVRYASSRQPGVDNLQSVICDDFGTCDTFDIAVSIVAPTVTLPFCDDFSGEPGLPNPLFWLDNDVFINDAFPIDAPTVGVASFDGVQRSGEPYGEGRVETDRLTSTFIDLSAPGGSVFLKYFLQLGGNAQAPEDIDQMRIEGRQADGTWVALRPPHFGNRDSSPDTSFSFFSVPIDSAALLHDRFQVRFAVTSNGSGSFDVWNLDYVRVELSDGSGDFDDIAFAAKPPSITAPYSAVPYSQFKADPSLVREELPIAVSNLFGFSNNVSGSRVEVLTRSGSRLLDASLLTGAQFNLPIGTSAFVNPIPPTPLADYRAALQGLTADDAMLLTTRYTLNIDTDQDQISCTLANDTATSVTVIDDYFAYDDGSAEQGLSPGGFGQRIALGYELAVEDTLRGLRFAFPRLGDLDASRQLINLEVYIGELDDTPEYQQILVRPFFVSTAGDSLQSFTTYRLENDAGEASELVIPPGRFFIGWQQAIDANAPIAVGLDVNTNNIDQVFSEYGIGWRALLEDIPTATGSLMARPVFSNELLENSSSIPLPVATVPTLRVAPNPTTGTVQLLSLTPEQWLGGRFTLRDATGRIVQEGASQQTLDLRAAPGLYLLSTYNPVGTLTGHSRIVLH